MHALLVQHIKWDETLLSTNFWSDRLAQAFRVAAALCTLAGRLGMGISGWDKPPPVQSRGGHACAFGETYYVG
jgi:hypothetical protein